MTKWWGSVYWGWREWGLIRGEGWRFIWRVPAYMTTPSGEGHSFTSHVVFSFLHLFFPLLKSLSGLSFILYLHLFLTSLFSPLFHVSVLIVIKVSHSIK